MGTDEYAQPGVSRGRLIEVALDLVQQQGLESLTMRGLADRLHVKPASLYWHVRDRGELVELLAQSLLAEARPAVGSGWRADALAACAALEGVTARRRDAARILLEAPEAVEESDVHVRLRVSLQGGGLLPAEAREVATMMLGHVLAGAARPADQPPTEAGKPVLVAIDTGSRGVTLRAGSAMSALIRVAHDPGSPAPAVIRGNRVVVRRLRGGRHGELELNPLYPWRVKVQAPTWNTLLDLRSLNVREIHVDSGATRVECVLPRPRGVVPVHVSSGVAGVRLRRASGVPVIAEVSIGVVQLRLDGYSATATATDLYWESVAGAAAQDHYRLRISSGTVRVTLEEDPSIGDEPVPATSPPLPAGVTTALHIVLDGVASRSAAPLSTSSSSSSPPATSGPP